MHQDLSLTGELKLAHQIQERIEAPGRSWPIGRIRSSGSDGRKEMISLISVFPSFDGQQRQATPGEA
jgi:hypothetical protein